jgi:hypothetical protein
MAPNYQTIDCIKTLKKSKSKVLKIPRNSIKAKPPLIKAVAKKASMNTISYEPEKKPRIVKNLSIL